jgi:hypothetical protein
MQPDLEGKMPTRATIARSGRFAPKCQTFAAHDPTARRIRPSTVHGVVFAFLLSRISVMEPFGC